MKLILVLVLICLSACSVSLKMERAAPSEDVQEALANHTQLLQILIQKVNEHSKLLPSKEEKPKEK